MEWVLILLLVACVGTHLFGHGHGRAKARATLMGIVELRMKCLEARS